MTSELRYLQMITTTLYSFLITNLKYIKRPCTPKYSEYVEKYWDICIAPFTKRNAKILFLFSTLVKVLHLYLLFNYKLLIVIWLSNTLLVLKFVTVQNNSINLRKKNLKFGKWLLLILCFPCLRKWTIFNISTKLLFEC